MNGPKLNQGKNQQQTTQQQQTTALTSHSLNIHFNKSYPTAVQPQASLFV